MSLLSPWHRDDGSPVMGFRVQIPWANHQDLHLVLHLLYAAQESLLGMLQWLRATLGSSTQGIFKAISDETASQPTAAQIYWQDRGEVFRSLGLPPSPSKPVPLRPFHWVRTDRCFLQQERRECR